MVNLKWNNDRFTFQLPPPETTPLRAIRDAVCQITHLPPDGFKLIHKGAVMKDDAAPISAYHIRESSTIAIIEIGQPPAQQAPPPRPPPSTSVRTEQDIISTIHSELATVRTELSPAVDAFLASRAAQQPQPKEHLRLSELLMRSLLRLDAVVADGEIARQERKAAVKEVQALLDQLDST